MFATERLVLRPIVTDDAGPAFRLYAQDAEVTRYLTWRPHVSLDETKAYVASCVAVSPNVSRTYVIVGRDDGFVRGAIDLRAVAPHRVEFGYLVARFCWGQGLMTEVLAEVVAWALARPGMFRVGAFCDVDNVGSMRVLEKAGLTREGLLRRWSVHPNISDAPRDCFSYGRVR